MTASEPTKRTPEVGKLRLLHMSKLGSGLFAGDYPITNVIVVVAFDELPSICVGTVDFRTHNYYYERWAFKIDKLVDDGRLEKVVNTFQTNKIMLPYSTLSMYPSL